MKPLTNDLKKKISINIKNKIDISDLIKDVDLKGADLSGAIVKNIQLLDCNISGSNWAYAKIGNPEKPCYFIRCNMDRCNFYGTEFTYKSWVRSCKVRNCNLKGANLAKVEYQYTDFTGSNFCGTVLKIGTREGVGCILPHTLFQELCKGWKNKVNLEEIEDQK